MKRLWQDPKSKFYFVSFYFKGIRYKKSTHATDLRSANTAQRTVNARLAPLNEGIKVLPEGVTVAEYVFEGKESGSRTDGRTVEELCAEYLAAAQADKPASWKTEKIHINHFLRFLGPARSQKPVSSITPIVLQQYKLARQKKVKNVTVSKEIVTLHLLFKFADPRGSAQSNPVQGITVPKTTGSLPRFRTKSEIDDILANGFYSKEETRQIRHCRYLGKREVRRLLELSQKKEPTFAPAVAIAALTGMRKSEISRCEVEDIDFKAGAIWARSRKQSKKQEMTLRDIDLHPKLRKILKEHMGNNGKGRYLFANGDGTPLSPDQMHYRFEQTVEGTEFEGIGFHCLRHSFASLMASEGVDQRIIDHWMGHQTEEMRKRYQHLFPRSKKKAIESLKI